MERWATSDTHFSHENIISYSGRPYADAAEMDETLIASWNAQVRPEDEVWHFGDVVMGKAALSLANVARLNGRKLLVPGNHDRFWSGGRKPGGWAALYEAVGFSILENQITVQVGSHLVAGCHFPYSGDSHEVDRYVDHRPVDEGRWLLHGHVHEAWRQRGRQINVGVDVWDYMPVHFDTLAAMIDGGPADLDRNGETVTFPHSRTV